MLVLLPRSCNTHKFSKFLFFIFGGGGERMPVAASCENGGAQTRKHQNLLLDPIPSNDHGVVTFVRL